MAGCHGGAGTTTVMRLLGPGAHEQPLAALDVGPTPLVLVTRGTADGTARATAATNTAWALWRQERLHRLPVLIVVGDGPWPEPAAARARVRLIEDQVNAVVRLPYITAWRYTDAPMSSPLPPKFARAVEPLYDLLGRITEREGVTA